MATRTCTICLISSITEPQDFDSEYNTVGGWATEQLDRFPKAGDEFTFDRYTVRVLETNGCVWKS